MCCSLNAGVGAQARASFQTHVAASSLARDSVACSSLEIAQGFRGGLVHSSPRLPHPQTQILCNCLDECRESTLCPRNKIKGCPQAEGRHTFIATPPVDACKPSLCTYSQRPKVSQPNSSKQSIGSVSFMPAVPPGPSHLLKQHKLQHTAGKHAVALAFSVQTVRPVLSIVVNYKGTKVLNLGSSTCLYCRSLQGHWQNHCFTTSVEPLALGSSPAG